MGQFTISISHWSNITFPNPKAFYETLYKMADDCPQKRAGTTPINTSPCISFFPPISQLFKTHELPVS